MKLCLQRTIANFSFISSSKLLNQMLVIAIDDFACFLNVYNPPWIIYSYVVRKLGQSNLYMQNFNFLSTKLDYLHNTILIGFSMWHEANEISVPVCFKLSCPICLPSRQTIIKTCIALWQSPRHNWWWSWGNATDKKFGITIFGPCTKK